MVDPRLAYQALSSAGITFWTGVPDSLLAPFCAFVADRAPAGSHVIAANEGGAVALAAGHYIGTTHPALVYLQNSGLGNTINPLVSLADPEVYAVPMVLLIGWRGQPGLPDEPQHLRQGAITCETLDALGVPYRIAPRDERGFSATAATAVAQAIERSGPVALIVPKDTFSPFAARAGRAAPALSRESAVITVADSAPSDAVIVATTGKAARELYEYRMRRLGHIESDFLTVGSMGHASQIALGIALTREDRPTWVLDGDGSLLMHMGSLAVIAEHAPSSFLHIVLNNGAHDSVGGQPTPTTSVDFVALALAAGYRSARAASTEHELSTAIEAVPEGPALIEVRVARGSRPNLGRPATSPRENRDALMRWLDPT